MGGGLNQGAGGALEDIGARIAAAQERVKALELASARLGSGGIGPLMALTGLALACGAVALIVTQPGAALPQLTLPELPPAPDDPLFAPSYADALVAHIEALTSAYEKDRLGALSLIEKLTEAARANGFLMLTLGAVLGGLMGFGLSSWASHARTRDTLISAHRETARMIADVAGRFDLAAQQSTAKQNLAAALAGLQDRMSKVAARLKIH